MLYRATHVTRYLYQSPVSQCLSEARLTPRTFGAQLVHESEIKVEPEPSTSERRQDYFGNQVSTFSVFQRHDRFTTTASSTIEILPKPEREIPEVSWNEVRELLTDHSTDELMEAYEFVFDSPFVPTHARLAEYGKPTFTGNRPLAEAVLDLSHRIHADFKYQPESTSIDIPLIKVLDQRKGVCQDFAHLMIGVLRTQGLAARYVSGYLRSGTGAEASHAWVSVFIPDYGWLQVDPTNDVVPKDGHLTVAWGRDYGDVTPVKGIALGGGTQAVQVEVRVVPI
jgi:transglutaminase-like putative cysteine protease